jgi:hypothetical protein
MSEWVQVTVQVPERTFTTFGGKEITKPAHESTEWHTKRCLEDKESRAKALTKFEAEHPNYCKDCGGAGVLMHTENGAPHGCGYWPMPVYDACASCIETGHCPLCGHFHEDEEWEGESCEACDWTWDSIGDVAPGPWECYCWEHSDYPESGWQKSADEFMAERDTVYAEYMDLYET